MFGGIIDKTGTITACEPTPGGRMLAVRAADYWHDLSLGASVAIDGVCLSLTHVNGDVARFDVIAETLRRSTLGELRSGARVNLQKSLAVGDRVDGHFVQGHVDAIGRVKRVETSERESIWWFSTCENALHYIVPKGSIAIDGISLTIAAVHDGQFSVALIPTTLRETTIGTKRVGAHVNLETDILARTIVHALHAVGEDYPNAGVSLETLRDCGFV